MVPQDRRDFKSDRYHNNRSRRDFTGHFGSTTTQVVSTVFREPVHQILEKIKNEPYFQWSNKMGRRPHEVQLKVFTANATKSGGILLKIARRCGVTWSSWLKLGS